MPRRHAERRTKAIHFAPLSFLWSLNLYERACLHKKGNHRCALPSLLCMPVCGVELRVGWVGCELIVLLQKIAIDFKNWKSGCYPHRKKKTIEGGYFLLTFSKINTVQWRKVEATNAMSSALNCSFSIPTFACGAYDGKISVGAGFAGKARAGDDHALGASTQKTTLRRPVFPPPLFLPPISLFSFFLFPLTYVGGIPNRSVSKAGRQGAPLHRKRGEAYTVVGNLLSDLAGQDLSSSDNRRKGERKDLYFTNIKNHRKICEMARNVIFLFLLLWRPSMQQVRTLQKAMIRELQKKPWQTGILSLSLIQFDLDDDLDCPECHRCVPPDQCTVRERDPREAEAEEPRLGSGEVDLRRFDPFGGGGGGRGGRRRNRRQVGEGDGETRVGDVLYM